MQFEEISQAGIGWSDACRLRILSRVAPVQMALCNSTRDEGRRFEVGNQVPIASHRSFGHHEDRTPTHGCPALCSIGRTIDVRFEVPPPLNQPTLCVRFRGEPGIQWPAGLLDIDSFSISKVHARLQPTVLGRAWEYRATSADACALFLQKPRFFRQPVLFETDAAGLFDPAAKTDHPRQVAVRPQ
jgi:hypothetical protein